MKSQGSIFHLAGYHGFHVILIVLSIMFFLSFGTGVRLQDKTPDNKKDLENIQGVQGSGSKIDQSQSINSVNHPSENITNESDSPALRSFLKNILKARDELKWIDQAANRLNDPNRLYGTNKGVHERRETIKDQRPSKDVRFSLGDRFNSNKNLQYERDNGENRWSNGYGVPRTKNDDSDLKMIFNQDKRKSSDTDESLEKLKQTVLELKENLTRRDDNSERNKAIEKALLNNNQYDKLTELDSSKRKSKDERKKDVPSFSPSKGQKHTERSNALANEDENTKLSWWNESESPEEIVDLDKSIGNLENQGRTVTHLRNKRINGKNDFLNEKDTNIYGRRKRNEGSYNKGELNFKEDSYNEKTNQDSNDYWRTNNYKELTNVDDLIAQQAKLLDYDNNDDINNNNNNNNNNNVLSETKRMTKRKTPKRGLFWIKENESNNRSLSNNNDWKCFIGKNHRRLLQSYDESFEEDLVTNEGSTRNEISKVAKSCRGRDDERKLGNEKSAINRDEEQRDNIDEDSKENFEGNVNEENDERDNMKAERYVRTLERAKNPYDARVNMMIKQRIAQKHKEDEKNNVRRKRYPLGIIEYYDYDEEINERSRDSQAIDDNEQKSVDKKENLVGSSLGLDDNLQESQNATSMKKKNEQAEEQEKEKKRKEQMKNKEPKQQFLHEQVLAKNENPFESLRSKVALEDEREENKSSQMNREKSFLNEATASGKFRNEKSSGRDCQTKWTKKKKKKQDEYDRIIEEPNQEFVSVERVVPKESLEYIFRGPETLQREIVDVVFGDVQPIEFSEREKKLDSFGKTRLRNRLAMKKLNEREYDDIDNVLYEELKKLYDWEDNENKNGPRLKGDQRMHQESDDDLENKTNNNDNDTSASNYIALKKTDDLFKGGVEQGDIFEERMSNGTKNHQSNPNYSNIGNIEWKVIPVVETINDSRSKSSGVLRSGLSKRKTAPETDSGSPYENGKYHDSMNELEENVPSIDGDKRSLLESKDMHESFVEPMDRIDDFDDDIKVRLGRGLKTINDDSIKNETFNDTSTSVPFINNENLTTTMNIVKMSTNYEINVINSSYYPREVNDNSNETIKKNEKKNRSSNESHSTVNSVKIESSSRPRLEPLANRNASRVKREGNSYSLNYDEGNPYDTYYSHSNDITKDLYTIDPYKYKENDNTHLRYNDLNDIYKPYEDDSNGRKINDRRKSKNKRRRNKKRKRKRKKNNKNKKRKRNKKKNKKDSKWKIAKKRAKNLSKDERHEFFGDSKRRRKLSKRRPFANFQEIAWRKGQRRQRKKKNMGAKKRKEAEKIEMKKYRETETPKGIRRNSNADIVAGANVVQRESVNDQNTMSEKETEDEDTRRKKLAMLLTADNMEDESQMDLALHGELAGKIVENIFEQVQKNEALKVALGPGLYRKNEPEDSTETDKTYRQGFEEDEIKHTEKTMKKVMELLGRLVLDEVQKKTCSALPPDMRQFLEWMLEVNGKKESEEQTPVLPLVHDTVTTERPSDDKILFPKTSDQGTDKDAKDKDEKDKDAKDKDAKDKDEKDKDANDKGANDKGANDKGANDKDVNELHKKVRILQNLINEYNALSAKEKIKVQTVHDYLVRQLNLLLHYIEMKEKSEKNKTGPKTVPAIRNAEFIHRYENASPNFQFDGNLTSFKDANLSDFWKFDNASFALDVKRKKRRPVRSYNYSVNKKRRKKRKKRKRKRRRRNERRYDKNETPEYRKLARHAAMIRQKRGDNLEDEWDQFDFKYERPEIYKSMNILNEQNGKIRNGRSTDLMKTREILKRDNVTSANLYSINFDDLPVKGKNLAEDEMILLNKRESWKKQNERQLEEVAFGKDMRNKLREEEQFERLTGIKGKKKIVNDEKPREKRENNKIEKIEEGKKTFVRSNLNNVTLININTTVVSYYELTTVRSSPNFPNDKIISLKKPNDTSENEEKLKMMERGINVYADYKNETSRTTEKKKKEKIKIN